MEKPLATTLLAALLALPAGATAEFRGPCKDDAAKFCAAVTPGDSRMLNCLTGQMNSLSMACRDRVQATQRRARKVFSACGDDVEQFCAYARPNKWPIIRCLLNQEANLTPECRSVLPAKTATPPVQQ